MCALLYTCEPPPPPPPPQDPTALLVFTSSIQIYLYLG